MPMFLPFFSLFSAAGLKAATEATPIATPGYLAEELGNVGQSALGANVASPSLMGPLLDIVFSLAFVVGLVYLAYWLLLRWRSRQGLNPGNDKQGLIKVLEKHYIDANHGVAVVELGDEIVYLGLAGQVTLLGKVSDPQEVERLRELAPPVGGFLGFQEQFNRAGAKLKQEEWSKTKRSLKTQADELKQQIDRLRGPRSGK